MRLWPLIFLAGCATNPDKIPAQVVDPVLYVAIPCDRLVAKRLEVREELARQERTQRSTAKHDAWGVLLVGIPMGSLGGGDVGGRIAQLKGELLAIDTAAVTCTQETTSTSHQGEVP